MRSTGSAIAYGPGIRSLRRACLVALGAFLLAMLLSSTAADAALVHPFIGNIAKNKKGFTDEVCGVSVDPASGEVVVSDVGAESVEVFDKSGVFLHKISSILVAEEETAQEKLEREEKAKKEIEKGKTPKEAAGKFEKEELEEFCGTVVNEKSHDVYIADGGERAVYPFNQEGKQVFAVNKEGKRIAGAEVTGKSTPAGQFGEELGVAIDQASGRLYVSDREHEAVDIFSEAGKYEGQIAFPGSAEDEHIPEALAVNQKTGELFVAVKGQAFDEEEDEEFGFVYVYDSTGKFLRAISGQRSGAFPGFGAEGEPLLTGLAVGPEGNLYVSDITRRAVFEFSAAGEFVGEITATPSGPFDELFSVAVNQTGDVYIADRTEGLSEERRKAEIGLEAVPGLVSEFGPAVAGCTTKEGKEEGCPTVESESVSDVTATGATLHAGLDPTGIDTSYHFELCQGSACTDVPALPGADLGAGEATTAVSQPVTGLTANTAYSYRVVLTFTAGGSKTASGAVQTFSTRTEGANVELPDGRAWELVSSPSKNGAGLESIPLEGGLIQASENGDALTYISLAPDEGAPEGNRVPTFAQLLAKRGPNEQGEPQWSSKDITLPGGEHASGAITGRGKQEYRSFSGDLELSLVEPLGLGSKAEPRLSPEDTERTIYTRKSEGCEAPPSSCYTPVVNASNVLPGTKFGGTEGTNRGVFFVDTTPDLSHVVLESKEQHALTKEAAIEGPLIQNFYEWSAATKQLQLVNVLPKKEPAEAAQPAPDANIGGNHVARHAISDDGTRVIFTSGDHLYSRNMTTQETVQADAPKTTGGEEAQAEYQTASSDGSKIFFTDQARLTAVSTAGTKSSDLYEFNVTTNELTDLSVDPSFKQSAERAAVQGLVPGVSEDGSTVYFVANGVLSTAPNANGERAQPGHCIREKTHEEEAPAGATCNLYAELGAHEGVAPTFIGRLSQDDLPNWENNNGDLQYVTTRVSPNGQYLAFMSDRRLTNYDNRDTAAAAHEAPDEEVFVYDDSAGGHLTCASCASDGTRPAGVFDAGSKLRNEEGVGLINDRVESWEGHWLAGELPGWTGTEGESALYQSHYLLDDGRLFFNTTTPLAQADTNGKMDVYEHEPNAVGGCGTEGGCTALISSGSSTHESAFLDASPSGDDVFVLTASALVTSDHDEDFDVYDARVCGSAGCIVPPKAAPTGCNSTEECRPETQPIPAFGSPASATTSSSGNAGAGAQSGVLPTKTTQVPTVKKKPTRAQLLSKALKSCKKLKKKSKRVACEKTARKKYGAKKKKTAKKTSQATKGKK
jgi:sugar lactone lactonase YvrE